MTRKATPLSRDEQIHAITVFSGWATSDGAVGGTTIVDTKLVGVNDYVTNKAVLIMSGVCKWELQRVASFVPGTGTITVNAAFTAQITEGVLYKLVNFGIGADLAAILVSAASLGLTTFRQETVAATDVNGVTWKDLLDKSLITAYTEIWSITVTKGGAWAGDAKLRITDGAGNKIFPFGTEAVENTDFTDAVQWSFPAPVCVPQATGYKIQFRSSNAADGAGETLALTELAIITRT